jgi:anaerobic magnesium-protoporphyrin IX monomethyl ester cyclase
MIQRHKVVLYNPISVSYDMPLALIAIGSALDASKYEVIIIDGRLVDPIPLLKQHLPGALCLGVTCLTSAPLKDAIKISEFARELTPNCPIIWGDWHTSLFPTQPIKDLPCVDITVQGQDDVTIVELMETLINKSPLEKVDGISFVNHQGIAKRNKARLLTDLNELPLANYHLIDVEHYFEKLKFYLKMAYKPVPPLLKPLQLITQRRIRKDRFSFLVEKIIVEKLMLTKKLS